MVIIKTNLMKKLIILFSVIALWSCEKEEQTYCYTCNVYKSNPNYLTHIDTCATESKMIEIILSSKDSLVCYKREY